MGVLAVFNALIAIIAPLGCMKYSLAIPIVKNNRILFNLIAISLMILCLITFIITMVLNFWGEVFLSFINMNLLVPYWYMIPIALFLVAFFEILSNFCIRDKLFTLYASATVFQKLLGSISKIVLGYLSIKPLGLLIGDIINQIGGIGVLTRKIWKHFRKEDIYFSIKRLSYVMQKFSAFPKYRVPSQIFLALSGSIPILFFAWKFDKTITGEISLARTMLSVPVVLLGTSIGKAFYGEIAQIRNNNFELLRKLTKNIIKKLFFLSLFPFFIILLGGPYIFQIVFGNEWYNAGLFARIMSLYLIFQFIYSPISEGIFNVCGKQKTVFILEFSRIILVIFSLGIATILNMNPLNTIFLYSVSLTLQYIISIYVVLKILYVKR